MIVIPSLELMGGNVVQLKGGRQDGAEVLAEDPVLAARELMEQGAVFFQLTDLDAVFGNGNNISVIERFVGSMIPCQVGGGIRDCEYAGKILELGVDRIVAGTLFFEHTDEAKALVDQFGVRVMAALDVEEDKVATRGWETKSELSVDEALDLLAELGVRHLVYTAIDRGDEPGKPDVDGFRELLDKTAIRLLAGVRLRTLDELADLRALEEHGLEGIVMRTAVATAAALSG